jgi:hypothetical protein
VSVKIGERLEGIFLTHPLLFILSFAALIRIIYLSVDYPLWWDSYVYLGMGKYIFSGGQLGMWESFRPLIHPFILGVFWKMGLNSIIVGKILDLIFSLLCVYLIYKISENLFSKNTTIITTILFAFTPVFIMFTGLILTEPLALLFGLLGVYFFLDKQSNLKNYLTGFFLGLSFLTKFPQGIWLAGVIIAVLLNKERMKEKIKRISLVLGGFLTFAIPYLILNYYWYGSAFLPLIQGSEIMNTALWQYASGWSYYLVSFFLKNPLYLLFFPALYLFFRRKDWKEENTSFLFLTSCLVIAYFLYLPRKELRYIIMAVPLLALITGEMVYQIYLKVKSLDKKILTPLACKVVFLLLLLIPLPTALSFERYPTFETQINQIQKEHYLNGTILTSDPAFVSYLDQPIVTLDGMEFAPTIYSREKGKYQLLFLNECDLGCAPEDEICQGKRKELLQSIYSDHEVEYSLNFKNCNYFILLPK